MPGAVIAITRKGKLAYYESFGFLDKAAGTPMPKDAIFALASMTKPMTAVAALMLAERGELLLNDPVGNYLPALKDMKVATTTGTEPARRQPTLQDMMRHTAGVTYGNQGTTELHKRYPSGNVSDTMTGSQFLETLGRLPLHYQPGTMWDYSFGLEVTGLAVESVTKQRLGDFLQARLFAPLGMVDTQFVVPAAKVARIAGAAARSRHRGGTNVREPVKPWQFDCGGGCASGTALDYTRFAMMLLNKGTLAGTRILSRKTVEYMTSDQLSADVNVDRLNNFAVEHIAGYGFGLGVAVRRQSGVAGVPGTQAVPLERGAGDDVLGRSEGRDDGRVSGQHAGTDPSPLPRVIKTLVLQAIAD